MRTHTSLRITIAATLLFLLNLLSVIHADHPCLFFSKSDIPALQQKAQTSHSEIWKPIIDYAEKLIGTTPAEYPSSPGYSAFRDGGNMLIPMALAYVITGDTKYADITKIYLEGYLKWPTWGGSSSFEERDLALAFMIMGNTIAYDWIYDELEDSLQVALKNKIAHHAAEMYEAATSHWTSGWNNWWGWSYAQNHWHVNNNALALAAFALEDEVDSADVWIDHITHQFAIDSFVCEGVNDGSWHESIQYHNARMTLSLPTYYNLKRLKNRDLLPKNYLKNFVYWSLYNHLPGTNRAALTFSSYVPPWGEGILTGLQGILRFVAAEYDNGHAEWLTQQIIDISGRYPNVYNAPYYVFEFFYFDPSVKPLPPDNLPLNRTFSDIECVIWRTGWEQDDLVFGLKCGAYGGKFFRDQFLAEAYPFDDTNSMIQINVGHDQPDAGTFYIV